MTTESARQATIKKYILDQFLPGEDPEQLLSTTPLISGGRASAH
jgi:hypothetical protein